MTLLPIFMKLDGRRGLLVGAGRVALEKIGSLLKTGLRLRVIAPEALPEIQALAAAGQLEWRQKSFAESDLDGNFLAIAATNSAAVNAAVYRAAIERRIPCNSVDDPPNCDFFFGSVVSRGELQVAVSTGGASPALAQRLRHEIDEQLPQDLGPWMESLGQLRREILATHPSGEARRLLLHQLAQRELCPAEDCPARRLAYPAPEEFVPDEPAEDCGYYGPETDAPGSNPAPHQTFAPLRAETVHLVGAGPGDPDLLTVKALRLIQTADVLLHDDLVPTAILDCASPSAEIVNVGKRCGAKTITQEEIHAQMIAQARAGRSVVRLKGGDPLLFGRAAEEIAALTAAGVPFQIVPGITAAFAAAAAVGCSLTDRGTASSVVIATGHHAQERASEAAPGLDEATRVIYMPGRDLRTLAEDWLRQGFSPDLPCAVVSRAAHPDQQVLRTTLGALGKAAPVAAPSLLIAGWALRRQ